MISIISFAKLKSWKIAALAGWVVCLCGSLYGQEGGPRDLPEGEGKELVAVVCTQCHGLRETLLLRYGAQGWSDLVDWMVMNGTRLSPGEAETVVRYLTTHFGPGTTPLESGPPAAQKTEEDEKKANSIPDGEGKELLEERCGGCHDLERVVSTKRTKAAWESVMRQMVKEGAAGTAEELRQIVTYLTTHFGKTGE